MANWNLAKEETNLDYLETLLERGDSDFCAAYMTVQGLHAIVRSHPEIIRSKTVSVLEAAAE